MLRCQFTASGAEFTYTDEDECTSTPCQHGATCLDSSDTRTVPLFEYSCLCARGWEGGNCNTDIDECASTPCRNGATCHESAVPSEGVPIDAFRCGDRNQRDDMQVG